MSAHSDRVKKHFDRVERQPLEGMSVEDIKRLHANIHFTQTFLQKESHAKMDEEEVIERVVDLNKAKFDKGLIKP